MLKSGKGLPRHVWITGAKFKVSVDPLNRQSREAEDGDWGESHCLTREIRVSSWATPAEQQQILWHEFVHMVLGRAGIDEILGDKQEEAVVLALEHAWEDVKALVRSVDAEGRRGAGKRRG